MSNLTVVDSIMGSGKTSWAIQYMNSRPEAGPYLYITPYLKEIDRVIESCTMLTFEQPEANGMRKSESLLELVRDGKNVAATHVLFRLMNLEVIEEIKQNGYTLIMDEVVEIIEPVPLKRQVVMNLFNMGVLELAETGQKIARVKIGPTAESKIFHIKAEKEPGETQRELISVKRLREWASANKLVWVNNNLLMWIFPNEAFNAFKEIFNLTYMFRGSYCWAYYKIYGFDGYGQRAVGGTQSSGYKLIPYDESRELAERRRLAGLVEIHEGPLNAIEEKYTDFGFNWWRNPNQKREREIRVRKVLYNWFRHYCDGGADLNMWTSFRFNEKGLRGKGYAGGFVSWNTRATNIHREKASLAYVINRFTKPEIQAYFSEFNFNIEETAVALSELLQWIWRSRIREGKPIKLFIPSSRMRGLLKQWLCGFPEIETTADKAA